MPRGAARGDTRHPRETNAFDAKLSTFSSTRRQKTHHLKRQRRIITIVNTVQCIVGWFCVGVSLMRLGPRNPVLKLKQRIMEYVELEERSSMRMYRIGLLTISAAEASGGV